jgi:hypothetical protein
MRRSILVLLVLNLVLSLAALGWLAAITFQPHSFLAAAYAQKGERGDPGPRGPGGAEGPPGPVGPDAQSAIDDLSSRVDDLEGYVQETDVADVDSRGERSRGHGWQHVLGSRAAGLLHGLLGAGRTR